MSLNILKTMLLCADTVCTTAELPAGLNRCELDAVTTAGECFIFLKCDYQFTDITSVTEWTTAQTNGDVVIAPKGFWSKALPTETTIDIACGEKIQTQEGDEFVFESSLIKKDDLADQNFYKTIRTNYAAYKVIPVTCDGQFIVTDEYVSAITSPGDSPGFDFTYTVSPNWTVAGANNELFKWFYSLLIPGSDILCRRYLPGVKAALQANQ